MEAIFGIIWLCIMCCSAIFSLLFFVVWVMALIDIFQKEDADFKKITGENAKVIWLLIVVFTGFIGALVYFVLEDPEKLKSGFGLRKKLDGGKESKE